MIKLGELYEDGKGAIPIDADKAKEWFLQAFNLYQRAADMRLGNALHTLGRMHLHGMGVPVDTRRALQMFLAAAATGEVEAQFYLGHLYEVGKGVPKNEAEALKW